MELRVTNGALTEAGFRKALVDDLKEIVENIKRLEAGRPTEQPEQPEQTTEAGADVVEEDVGLSDPLEETNAPTGEGEQE